MSNLKNSTVHVEKKNMIDHEFLTCHHRVFLARRWNFQASKRTDQAFPELAHSETAIACLGFYDKGDAHLGIPWLPGGTPGPARNIHLLHTDISNHIHVADGFWRQAMREIGEFRVVEKHLKIRFYPWRHGKATDSVQTSNRSGWTTIRISNKASSRIELPS